MKMERNDDDSADADVSVVERLDDVGEVVECVIMPGACGLTT